MQKEFKIIELNAKINEHVNKEVNRQQREFLLREQLEAIKKELGEADDDEADVIEMNKKLDKVKLTPEARKTVEKEIERLAQILSRRKKNNPILIGEPGRLR